MFLLDVSTLLLASCGGRPATSAYTFLAWTPLHTRYVESLLEGGTYQWWVTVKNSNLQAICTSQVCTFTKPEAVVPTQPPGLNLFWNQNGPTSQQASCGQLDLSVSTSLTGMIKVVYNTTNSTPVGSYPHIIIGNGPGTGSGSLSGLGGYVGTVNWSFAVVIGDYFFDSNSYSFTCP